VRRGSYKTEAVVLNSHDFGESDRVLTFYTENFGKLSGIAKGARRSRKRFVGSLDPTVRIRMGFFSSGRAGLVRVESASIIEAYNALRCDIELYSRACCMLELAAELTREGQVGRRVYAMLADFLRLLTPGGEPTPALYPPPGPSASHAVDLGSAPNAPLRRADAAVRFFEIKLLSILGYMPRLSGCVVCGTLVPAITESTAAVGAGAERFDEVAHRAGIEGSLGEPAFFCSDRGGLVCRGCSAPSIGMGGGAGVNGARGAMVPVSRGTASLLATAIRFAPEKLSRLRPTEAFLRESETVLDTFIKHILGKELRTRVFIDKLRKASF
jgi:DNA repair protein RecO (recombination protein O)